MKLQEIAKGYPVALGSLIGLIAFAGLGFWRSSQFDDLKETLAAREQESERLSSNVRNAAKLNAQLEQLATLTDNIQTRLTNAGDLAANQQYFYKFESDNKVKLADLKQAPAVRTTKKRAYTFYSTVSYTLRVQGDYVHILEFLRSIESGPRFVVIEGASFDLASASKKEDEASESTPLVLTLNLQFLGTL